MRPRDVTVIWSSLAAAILLAGCSTPRLTFDEAPASDLDTSRRTTPEGERNVVALAPIRDRSSNPLGWSDLGESMTDVVVRSLHNDARVEVRLYEGPLPPDPKRRAELVREAMPDANYLVVGEVTDFNHTDKVAEGSLRRLGIFGHRREAFSSISLEVLRLVELDIVLQDHVYGTADVPRDVDMPGAYANLGPHSYLFWSTPLGQATREALEETIERIETLPMPKRIEHWATAPAATGAAPSVVATSDSDWRIVDSVSLREVVLDVGADEGLAVGDRLRVLASDGSTIVDPVLGTPIEVVVLSVRSDRSTGHLSGDLGGRSAAGLILARESTATRAGVPQDR